MMTAKSEPTSRTVYVVVFSEPEKDKKPVFYEEKRLAEKAANASSIRPGRVYRIRL
jgi:hypothetical protein